MAIGKSKLHEMLLRGRKLNESQAWDRAVDYKVTQDIIRLIQGEHLTNKGIDKNGKVIGRYSYATELITQGRKKKGEHYTLKDSGYFYDSMRAIATPNSILIDADAKKDDDNLFEKYGTSIIGLTNENTEIPKKWILENYKKQLVNILFNH
jgi:hypothetical protein